MVSASVLVAVLLVAVSVETWAPSDHFSAISLPGDPSWYRNFGGSQVPQIQDQDIFYSNLGSSVSAAARSDIIFLGPSFVSYAVDRATLQAAPLLDRLNIYNMAFIGIRGGEFSRRVIRRWEIRPPLWVINVDDQFTHFFSNDLNVTLGPMKQPVGAVERSRLRGFMTVVGRNLRWRIEDGVAAFRNGHYAPHGLYRNVANGDMALGVNPSYLAPDNKLLRSEREPNCATAPEVAAYGRRFLQEVGGQVVLMLVPHSQSCVSQAAELARAIDVELIAPPFDSLTTLDGGGHLDKKGAEVFTRYLAAELIKTRAFKQAFSGRLEGKD